MSALSKHDTFTRYWRYIMYWRLRGVFRIRRRKFFKFDTISHGKQLFPPDTTFHHKRHIHRIMSFLVNDHPILRWRYMFNVVAAIYLCIHVRHNFTRKISKSYQINKCVNRCIVVCALWKDLRFSKAAWGYLSYSP